MKKNSIKNICKISRKALFSTFVFGMFCFNANLGLIAKADDDLSPVFDMNSGFTNKRTSTTNLPFQYTNQFPADQTSIYLQGVNKQISQPHQNPQQFAGYDLSNSNSFSSQQSNNSVNYSPRNNALAPNQLNTNPDDYWKPAPTNFTTNNSSINQFPVQTQIQTIAEQPVQGLNKAIINKAEVDEINMPLLNEAIKNNPQTAEEFFKRGVAKYRVNDFTGAIEDLDKVIEKDLIDKKFEYIGEVYLYRGRCKKSLKDSQGAVSDFKQSLQLNPGSANFYLQSGISREKEKDFAGAVSEYTKALEYKKDYIEAYINRGYAKAKAGNLATALQDLNKAIELDGDNSDAYHKRGFIRYQMRNYKGSMEDHEKAKNLYQQKGDMQSYQSIVQSINLLREIMIRN